MYHTTLNSYFFNSKNAFKISILQLLQVLTYLGIQIGSFLLLYVFQYYVLVFLFPYYHDFIIDCR